LSPLRLPFRHLGILNKGQLSAPSESDFARMAHLSTSRDPMCVINLSVVAPRFGILHEPAVAGFRQILLPLTSRTPLQVTVTIIVNF
jgi:hypothetical protein